jgi:Domain of unknown function (DUF3784)
MMDYGLFAIGVALLLISYLVGVKKQTWLLAGFNEKMIKDKSLLGTITGMLFFLPLGLLGIVNSLLDYAHEGTIFVIVMLVLLTVVYVFINRKLLK